jgi:uncharacterized protein
MKLSDALREYRSEIRDIVASHGALAPRVFGSVVLGTDTEESDSDLLVDPSPRTTLMTLAAIQLDAERLLGVHVAVLTPNSIPQRSRDWVLLDAISVWSQNTRAGFPNISSTYWVQSIVLWVTSQQWMLSLQPRHPNSGRRNP